MAAVRALPTAGLHRTLVRWFDAQARDLPWRGEGAQPWPVLVSEVMLQQTPVVRVVPVFESWLARWPTPAALAADPAGEAVRMWGRLGYPRRALRLHAAAVACVERYDGDVPAAYDDLRTLPGVGDYTAAAVASFAHGARHVVLDTNVRRVVARLDQGVEREAVGAPTAAERLRATALLPDGRLGAPVTAARWNAALMELGAVLCTARSPSCGTCPVAGWCAWRLAGSPADPGPPRRGQRYEGTDRQARGALLAVLRESSAPVTGHDLAGTWDEPVQRARALDGLVRDGLVEPLPDGTYRLPA